MYDHLIIRIGCLVLCKTNKKSIKFYSNDVYVTNLLPCSDIIFTLRPLLAGYCQVSNVS